MRERESLIKTNAEARAALKQRRQEVAILEQGNEAVDREIMRMNEENATLLESHLNAKHVINNFSLENDQDAKLIKQFEESNRRIREQTVIEKSKISEARNLIKLLKQELIQV